MTGAEFLILASVAVPPLLAAVMLATRPGKGPALRLACVGAALPAVVVGLLPADTSETTVVVEWMLLGTTLRVDLYGRLLLLLVGVVWAVSAGGAGRLLDRGDRSSHRFGVAWMGALTGNVILVLAGDAITFYFGFAVMSLLAYLLVIHDGTDFARRAGRIYLVMAIVGDVALLVGIILAVAVAGTTDLGVIPAAIAGESGAVALLVLGLGVKVGLPLLHMWLPLAHPAAPVPASAVLSGVMIKAGLVGWLRLLPIGGESTTPWLTTLTVAGLVAVFGAAIVGLTQQDPKILLAYSSISQMGLITLIVASGLGGGFSSSVTFSAATVFALHHGLAKGALFLSVGVAKGGSGKRWARLVVAAAALPAGALVGLPFTSGALAKEGLKQAVMLPGGISTGIVVSVSSVVTTLLLIRFLFLIRKEAVAKPAWVQAVPGRWLLLGSVVVACWWLLPAVAELVPVVLDGKYLVDSVWPVAVAGAIVFAFFSARFIYRPKPIPAGDLIVVLEGLSETVSGWKRRMSPRVPEHESAPRWRRAGRRLARGLDASEHVVGRWEVAVGLVAVLAVLLTVVTRGG